MPAELRIESRKQPGAGKFAGVRAGVFSLVIPVLEIAVGLGAFASAGVPVYALEPVTARSQSGRFVVRGLPFGPPPTGTSGSAVAYLRLDPTLTAVSFERIQHEVCRTLGLDAPSSGLVRINTHPALEDDVRVRLTSMRFNDTWAYQLDLPDLMDRGQFVRVAVQVVLQAAANPTKGEIDAPLPPWLVEGLAEELRATSLTTLALEPGSRVAQRESDIDPLRQARATLRTQSALKLDQLFLPAVEDLEGESAAIFRACAQVFVHELLRLRDGRKCLAEMVRRLHENLNWQTTFLRAFHVQFPRLVDVDKWYSVNVATFSGRDTISLWPIETTLAQLDEVLGTPVQVRAGANDLPVNTTVSLQRIVTEWDFKRQRPVLLGKLQQMQSLRLRGAPELLGLVDAYLKTLSTCASARLSAPAARDAVRQLDTLDAHRQTWRLRMTKTARAQ